MYINFYEQFECKQIFQRTSLGYKKLNNSTDIIKVKSKSETGEQYLCLQESRIKNQNIIINSFKQIQRMQKQTAESFFTRTIADFDQLFKVHKTLSDKFEKDIQTFGQNNAVQQTFISQCLNYLGDESAQQGKRFEALTLLQPALVQKFESFQPEIQDAVRSGLLNIALARYKSIKTLGTLGLVIREIMELDNKIKDGFNQWIEPLGEIVKWMGSEQPGVAEAGVQFFIYLLKQTPFTSQNSQIPMHKLSKQLLQSLFTLFTTAPQQKQHPDKISLRQKILYLSLQVVKSFSYFDGSNDSIVKQCFGDTIQLWASLLVSILKSAIGTHLGIKKYAVKILIVMYRDMSSLCERRLKNANAQAQLLSTWQFAYKFIPVYLAVQVWGLKQCNKQQIINTNPLPYFDQDYDIALSPVQSLTHNILQLLLVFSSSSLLPFLTRLSIYHILNALFHYYIISSSQLNTWSYNPLYFVTPMEHQSIRGKILGIINDVIEKNGDYGIQALLVVAQKFLMNYRQAHTVQTVSKIIQAMNISDIIQSGRLQVNIKVDDLIRFMSMSGCDVKETLQVRGETWRKSQVALSILGRFSQDIIVFQSKQQGAFDIQNFVKGLIKQFDLEDFDVSVCLLKGQTLYCLTRFTQIISIRYKHLFTDLVVGCSTCVGESYPTAIRVTACKSLTIFLRKIQKHKLKLTEEQVKTLEVENKVNEGVMTLQLTPETNSYALETLIQLVRYLGPFSLNQEMTPLYLLDNLHKNISHPNMLKTCFNFLQLICSQSKSYENIILAYDENNEDPIIPHFIRDCLQTYINIVKSQQKKYLKNLDIDLITAVLKLADIVIEKCPSQSTKTQNQLVQFTSSLTEIIQYNQNLQIQVPCTICLKNMIRLCPNLIKQKKFDKNIVDAIHCLLKIPADKTLQGASIYVGNLILLSFEYLIEKPDQQILQQVVLKVFKSRTPSVIQSLVLVYSRMINGKTDLANPFGKGQWQNKLKNITDFLASFSIENRMGLKILVDKWLLQQSLFRGTYTKISTFMALSKMFLLRDKRIDNLMVIGFNPSHTNISNDVNAPLKILATLIRCLNNEMGGKDQQNDNQQQNTNFQMKQQTEKGGSIDVGLEKFKQTAQQTAAKNQQVGSLADRENQQGSTCYMSAMLQFYDDGQQCDETTEQDLIFLKDSSTKFTLSEYLTDFFLYLNNTESPYHSYFVECLRQLLKEDVKILQKYVKVVV